MLRLPAELWKEVFHLAVDDGQALVPIPTDCMAESTWYKMVFGEWWLRSPRESLNIHERKCYATKKAIISTCKAWRALGSEFLFRSILVSDSQRLRKLCAIFDIDCKLGWWTRKIHVYHDNRGYGKELSTFELEDALTSLIRHCPNLEIFILEIPMDSAFGTIAETLCTFCPAALRCVQWVVPSTTQSKVVSVLDSMRNLTSLHIQFSPPVMETEKTLSGSGALLGLSLPCLQYLSLSGSIQDFVEQVAVWHMPELVGLTVDFGSNRHDFPDILELVGTHGPQLTALDLNSIPPFDVASILAICPNLTCFSFNLDWALGGLLTNAPHEKIERVGLHGLRYAFGVGYAAAYASIRPFQASAVRRCNDANFAALNRWDFPALRTVRVLDPALLRDLNTANGPAEGPCYGRWERWWDQCASQRIRLEDCTGSLLGTLPQDPEDMPDDDESESDDESCND